jgi:transcription antitermination factor NusG
MSTADRYRQPDDVLPGSARWYAIRVNANCERRAVDVLRAKGYESLVPLGWHYRTWANRLRKVERAMIPGYVFSRFDPQFRMPILTAPGVAYIVGTRSGPIPVDPHELAAICRIAESAAIAEPWPFLTVGQIVSLESGPLRGVRGRLVSQGRDTKVVVSITLLQRSVAVEVDRSWICPTRESEFDGARVPIDAGFAPVEWDPSAKRL